MIKCKTTVPGLLTAGGRGNDGDMSSMSLWTNPLFQPPNCTVFPLPEAMSGHTLSYSEDTMIACYGTSCLRMTDSNWTHLQDTLEERRGHTATVLGKRILLAGGRDYAATTTEWMPMDGGVSVPGFRLWGGREGHCVIKISDSRIIFTGGRNPRNQLLASVTEYSVLEECGWDMAHRELPGLDTPLVGHACGVYQREGRTVRAVALL